MTPDNRPTWDMKLSLWGVIIGLLAAVGAYYGQKEATSVALTKIEGSMLMLAGEIASLKASITRIESDKYAASDSKRDFAWRDERAVELAKRITDLEMQARRRH